MMPASAWTQRRSGDVLVKSEPKSEPDSPASSPCPSPAPGSPNAQLDYVIDHTVRDLIEPYYHHLFQLFIYVVRRADDRWSKASGGRKREREAWADQQPDGLNITNIVRKTWIRFASDPDKLAQT